MFFFNCVYFVKVYFQNYHIFTFQVILVNEYYKFLFPISFVFLFVRDVYLILEEGGGFSGFSILVFLFVIYMYCSCFCFLRMKLHL